MWWQPKQRYTTKISQDIIEGPTEQPKFKISKNCDFTYTSIEAYSKSKNKIKPKQIQYFASTQYGGKYDKC